MAAGKYSLLVWPLVSAWSAPAQAAEITGYAVLTTDYVFRGISYSDGHAAAQLGGEIEIDSGLYFGAWASTVDLARGAAIRRDLEVDYYIGYGLDVAKRWRVGANVVSYNFPGTKGPFDYDYVEYSINCNYDDRVWFEYSYSPDLFHSGASTHNYEIYAEWQPGGNVTVGGGAGLYDVSELAGADYSYWQLGITHPLGLADVDLRYFDTSDSVPIISEPYEADARIVLSLRFQF